MPAPARAVAALVAAALAAAAVAPAAARTLVVRPDGAGPHATIQAALDAARDGDEVVLEDGVYAGEGNRDLDFRGCAVTLRSRAGDPARCVIDAAGGDWSAPHRGLRFGAGEGPGTRVVGLTVRHGQATGPRPPAGSGGAVHCSGASPTFVACVFTACRATTGGAVACDNGAAPRFERCVFRGCTATYGGALHAFQAAPVLVGCELDGNTAGNGGAVAAFAGAPALTGCTLARNSATTGGAVSAEQGAQVALADCVLAANHASFGGGLFALGARARCARVAFRDNSAGAGAALCARGGAEVELEACELSGSVQGGAAAGDDASRVRAARTRACGNRDGDWTGPLAGQEGRDGNLSCPGAPR